MTFAAFEASQSGGEPVELISIQLDAETFRWSTSEDDYELGGETYVAAAVVRGTIQLSAEQDQDVLEITVPSSEAFPKLYSDIVPGQKATMTIRRVHRPDPDQQAIVLFKGIVQAVAYSNDGTRALLHVRPITAGLSQRVPRYTFQALCNHFLFDARCKVLQSSFQFTAAVSVQAGAVLTVPGLNVNGDGWATAGFVQLGTTDFRLILSHVGDDITLLLPFPHNVTGATVDVFAGCAHDLPTCITKFANPINYGGFPFVPLKNIFEKGIK